MSEINSRGGLNMTTTTTTTGKATKISLFSLGTPQMRAFHMTWVSFFLCFFGWFGIAPLMAIVRADLGLTKGQIGNIIIASVGITIFARLITGWLCDKYGPRLTYTGLLILGSLPVIFIGFSNSYESFLIFRLAIGVIGASFVITQYHTSVMFDKNIVGTANALAGGWGNLGGGVTQIVMPLIFAGFVGLGYSNHFAWRFSMVVPGVMLLVAAIMYYRFTQDTPDGNVVELRKTNPEYQAKAKDSKGSFTNAMKDYRVWILFLAYGCSFGVEITIDNIAALYYIDNYGVTLKTAGLIAGSFGFMNLFARAMGGYFGDYFGRRSGIKGRANILGVFLCLQGLGIVLFSQMTYLPFAIVTMILFALFVKMSNGACYSVVPFIKPKAIGAVSGIVGAGGNVGAVLMGFLLKSEGMTYKYGLFLIGISVAVISIFAYFIAMKRETATETVDLSNVNVSPVYVKK